MSSTTPYPAGVAGASGATEVVALKHSLEQTRTKHRIAVSDLKKKILQHVQLQKSYYALVAVLEDNGSGMSVL